MLLYKTRRMKINLEYDSNIVPVSIEPYQTIRHLKEVIMKLFYPMNFVPRLFFLTKDISDEEDIIVGDMFKNKSSVTVLIREPNPVLDKKESMKKTSQSERSERDKRSTFNDSKLKASGSKVFQKNECSCSQSICNSYCFSCQRFYCKMCKAKHNSHKTAEVDKENISESIKIYSISLQSELTKNLNKVKEFDRLSEANVFIDVQSRKEMIIRKLNQLEQIYNDKMKQFQQEFSYDTFECITSNLNRDIEKIMQDVEFGMLNKRKSLPMENAKKCLDTIYSKEKLVEKISEEVQNYGVIYSYSKKMDDLYNSIESLIDPLHKDISLLSRKRGSDKTINDLNAALEEIKKSSSRDLTISDGMSRFDKYEKFDNIASPLSRPDSFFQFSHYNQSMDGMSVNPRSNKSSIVLDLNNRNILSPKNDKHDKTDSLSEIQMDTNFGFQLSRYKDLMVTKDNKEYKESKIKNSLTQSCNIEKWLTNPNKGKV